MKSKSMAWLTPGVIKAGLICGGVLALVLMFGKTFNTALRKLFEFVGLAETAEEKAVKQAAAGSSVPTSPWSPERWKNKGRVTLSVTQANRLAEDIHSAISPYRFWGDNEQAVYAAFKSCRTQSDVSLVVWRYLELYQLDLFNDLHPNEWWNSYGLNDTELQTVINIVNGLPNE